MGDRSVQYRVPPHSAVPVQASGESLAEGLTVVVAVFAVVVVVVVVATAVLGGGFGAAAVSAAAGEWTRRSVGGSGATVPAACSAASGVAAEESCETSGPERARWTLAVAAVVVASVPAGVASWW